MAIPDLHNFYMPNYKIVFIDYFYTINQFIYSEHFMGKFKEESDNQMDIEDQAPQKTVKKNKKIIKAKTPNTSNNSSTNNKVLSTNQFIKKTSKLVNLKKKERPLQQKQKIFNRVVEGLKVKSSSKKDRKKIRILMKKQLRKALGPQQKIKPKVVLSTMQSQAPSQHSKKKQPMNQKKQVQTFRKNMGMGLSSLKNMLSQRLQS